MKMHIFNKLFENKQNDEIISWTDLAEQNKKAEQNKSSWTEQMQEHK